MKFLFDNGQLCYSLQAFWEVSGINFPTSITIPTMLAEWIKSAPFSTWKYKYVELLSERIKSLRNLLEKVFSKMENWTQDLLHSNPPPYPLLHSDLMERVEKKLYKFTNIYIFKYRALQTDCPPENIGP
jgi:hypothetical protein